MIKKSIFLIISFYFILTFVHLSEIGKFINLDFSQDKSGSAFAYPPAVGIMSDARSCLSCHVNNGPWEGDEKTIIDILDKETKKSLKQSDGTFLIEAIKNERKTVLTVIGQKKNISIDKPYKNAWLYIDTSTIAKNTLSKFAPGWEVNLQMACRMVGDKLSGFDDADITSLPMTIKPLEDAKDTELQLQVMLIRGAPVKGDPSKGMLGNYFERKVKLKVIE